MARSEYGVIDTILARTPDRHKFDSLYALFALVVIAGVFAIGYMGKHTWITNTRVVHVQKSWGTPTQSMPASGVSVQGTPLSQAGMTACDYYQGRNTLVCHP